MELTFDVMVFVGSDIRNNDKKFFEVEYEAKKEDLEEFAKSQGFNSFTHLVDECWGDDDIDAKKQYLRDFEEGKTFLLEAEISVIFGLERELKDFLVKKYQKQFEKQLVERLTIKDNEFEF